MFDLLLHPDRFWVKTFWPITVAALCVWLASKIIAHANAGRWLWRACLLKLLAVSLVPISLAIEFLPAECRDLIWSLIAAVATTVFFFHPLVWFARRRLLMAQESAADGLTLRVTGASVGQCANLVVRIIEKSHRIRTRPAFVVRAGSTFRELKERIEKMHARPRSNALVVSLAIVAVIVSLLPWHADFVRPAAAGDEPATRPRETKSAAGGAREFSFRAELREVLPDFPYSVRFQQGATRLPAGDKIVITEVKGTAETMAPGNIYLVRGTYKLTSHERTFAVRLHDRQVCGRTGRVRHGIECPQGADNFGDQGRRDLHPLSPNDWRRFSAREFLSGAGRWRYRGHLFRNGRFCAQAVVGGEVGRLET